LSGRADWEKGEIKLFCNQVFVSDSIKEIVPKYLLPLRGVIDSTDIPLNVSRSALQTDRKVRSISSFISKKIANNTNSNLEEQDLNELSIASSGLTELKVKQVTAKALAQRGKISKEDIKDIIEEKKQVISRSEILEFFEVKSSQDDIGGLNVLKVWLNQRYRAFSKEARDYGLPIPKGVLLVGAQGTGKSLTA